VAVVGIDRDERRIGIVALRKDCVNRALGRLLGLEIDGCVDAQAAVEQLALALALGLADGLEAVVVLDEPPNVVHEVGGRVARVVLGRTHPYPLAADPCGVQGAYPAELGHLVEHQVPPRRRDPGSIEGVVILR
jgi:hypothetical protein